MDLRRYELNAISPPSPTGSFAFTTTGTNNGSTGIAAGGNSFASFLLGQVDTFSIDLQQRTIRPRDYIHEFFAQDDYRVTPKLILNIGARWTLHMPSTEKTNQGAVFNLVTQQLDYLGVNGNSRSARELHWGNVAPRLGFAYSPDAKTVIRSGFGIVFIDQSGITTPFTTPQYPFIQNVQQRTKDGYAGCRSRLSSGPTVNPVGTTPDAGLGQSVYTVNKSAGSGYSEQWNLAVQRAITNKLVGGNCICRIAYRACGDPRCESEPVDGGPVVAGVHADAAGYESVLWEVAFGLYSEYAHDRTGAAAKTISPLSECGDLSQQYGHI